MTTLDDDLQRARAELEAWPDLTWRPWGREDLPAVSAMLTEVEQVDQPSERHSLDELEEYLASPRSSPDRDTLAAWLSDGTVAAVARALCRDSVTERRTAWLAGAVRPDLRGRGLGRSVMAWEVAAARAWREQTRRPDHGPLRLSVYNDRKASVEKALAERHGLGEQRYYAELVHRYAPGEVIEVPVVPGITICPFDAVDPTTVLGVRNASFRDHWGSLDTTAETWAELLAFSTTRTAWSTVAVDESTGEVVSFLLAAAYQQDWEPQGYTSGYIELLGTLRSHRGRGLGTALIHNAMLAFLQEGLDAAEIGVDAANPSGAFGLYTSLGFTETAGTRHLIRDEP